MPKKTERGDPLGFLNIRRKISKNEGGPFGEFFFEKKSHRAENTLRVPFGPVEFLK